MRGRWNPAAIPRESQAVVGRPTAGSLSPGTAIVDAMVPPAATDVNPDTLRRSGHWALFWELIHARGSAPAVEAAWAELTDDELPAARAGLEAARQARQARFSERARAKARRRIAENEPDHVDDPISYALQLANGKTSEAR